MQLTIVNQSSTPAAIHWHGMSWRVTPTAFRAGAGRETALPRHCAARLAVGAVDPAAQAPSCTTRTSTRRSRWDPDSMAIIVLEPGERFDPESDRLFFFGTAGTQ